MVTASEIVALDKDKPNDKARLATVAALFENQTAQVQFYGEAALSQKGYSYLASYQPEIGDTVLLLPILDTYIIAGEVIQSSQSPPGIITQEDIEVMLQSYAKSSDLQNYAVISHSHGNYAASNHEHTSINYNGYVVRVFSFNLQPAFLPLTDNECHLGSTVNRWKQVYATTGTINTSDSREKKEINELDQRYEELFKQLKPTSYKFIDNDSDRLHVGFIAQDVEENLRQAKLDSKDFAGFIKTPVDDDYLYGLRYSEFIALNTHMIQKLIQRIEALEYKAKEVNVE